MKVRNQSDLRIAYINLSIFAAIGKADHPKAQETKREIRAFNNRPAPASVIVQDNGMDGYVSLQQLPEFTDSYTLAEVQEYFEECMTYTCPNSQYDCTGAAFTSWFKVFRRRGHWFAYHSVCFDV